MLATDAIAFAQLLLKATRATRVLQVRAKPGLATPSTQPFPTTAECRASRVLCRLTAGLATAPSVSLTGQRAHAGQHGLLKKHTHTFQVIRPFDAHGCALYHNPR